MVEMDLVKVSRVSEWPEPRNKREVQSFVRFVNFYRQFFKDFSLTMHTPSLTSLRKMLDGIGESWSRPLSIKSRSRSPLHPSLSSPMNPSPTSLKPIPPMQPLEQSYPNGPHQRMGENGTQLPSSPRVSAWSSGTTRSMTRRCWLSSKHWRSGGTSLKVPHVSLKSGQTTKTSNTSTHLRS